MSNVAKPLNPRRAQIEEYAGGSIPFADWLQRVDEICERRTGMSVLDLEDFRWRDAFDDDERPAAACRRFLEEIGL